MFQALSFDEDDFIVFRGLLYVKNPRDGKFVGIYHTLNPDLLIGYESQFSGNVKYRLPIRFGMLRILTTQEIETSSSPYPFGFSITLDRTSIYTFYLKGQQELKNWIEYLKVSCCLSNFEENYICLLYTSPSPRDRQKSRMPSSA
eukprot:TRINITY_DN24485_c0_g1_i2.p1 TRINITY_DN24485_c0_g1~~TRINITY_DN24485_c0_g1_i2.p1  ORF type:complete len:145 (+),score=13.10 TRINITY_DN24485_c0_g1_i2:145-579(+)